MADVMVVGILKPISHGLQMDFGERYQPITWYEYGIHKVCASDNTSHAIRKE